jgi:hypothetical protein
MSELIEAVTTLWKYLRAHPERKIYFLSRWRHSSLFGDTFFNHRRGERNSWCGERGTAADTLRRLYWDTALSWRPPVLRMLGSVVGMSQALFGSDYPYLRRDLAVACRHEVSTGKDGVERLRILRQAEHADRPCDRLVCGIQQGYDGTGSGEGAHPRLLLRRRNEVQSVVSRPGTTHCVRCSTVAWSLTVLAACRTSRSSRAS